MKLLTTAAGAAFALPMLLAVTVAAVTAACITNPLTCTSDTGAADADPTAGQYRPDDGATTAADLDAVSRAIGAPVPAYSVLRDTSAYGTGWGGPSVNMLAPSMKIAVARLEIAISDRLNILSGYRTAGYQAQLCQRVIGPCAPPGRSMHQLGLAVDVTNWSSTLPHPDDVGLCQPLPSNDAGHLSHHTGREC